MYLINKIIAQTVLTFGIVIQVHSEDPNTTSYSKKYSPSTYKIFPNASQNEMDLPVIPYNRSILIPNVTTVCWPDISKAYWGTVLHHDPKYTGKHFQKLMARYKELNMNFVDHLRQMIIAADEIRALLYYNSTQEEIMEAKNKTSSQESTTTSPKKEINVTAEILKKCNCTQNVTTDTSNNINTEFPPEDSSNSITVPILLIVILILLTYIAFLYRKLQFARYKDAQILVQDELIDPWAT